ncbi:uncharacterized protein AMSG_12389 [Thecamonas trahens ATCC 50062]|uniref:Calmodulin n=1 Tax=Thecamonas trahens ATCC 50062 TaxID=461836 RepID=A0A0L0DT19_THETB|nr:hypothetical protein AMSG_12389 [Thecamonas trahens ATCC 50062]KNC55176.1 hypothetical protein AMSG_12389 [Thecamonas trahens ATCC 50062]|eukprot:XP_013753255.1 hypothetical protein AMSG_12389 [Thecamonas trahens ATCC 50062]
MEQLNETQLKEMQDNFALFDRKSDGVIDFDELFETFTALGLEYTEAYTRTVFVAADTNNDERIDFAEFVTLLMGVNGDESSEIRHMFNVLDRDNSGSLTAEKVLEGMLKLGVNVTEDEVKAMVEEMDADGNGEVDFSEFRTIWLRMSLGSVNGISAAVERYGVAPGAAALLRAEYAAAREAMTSSTYLLWRCSAPENPAASDFCTRIGSASKCFCRHTFADHDLRTPLVGCTARLAADGPPCPCRGFRYIPSRPEEIGDSHLVRRRGFRLDRWRPKCSCSHGYDVHRRGDDSRCRSRGCSCRAFSAAFRCAACDGCYADHELVVDSRSARAAAGLPVDAAFLPLADAPELQAMVFADELGLAPHIPTGAALDIPLTADGSVAVYMPPPSVVVFSGEPRELLAPGAQAVFYDDSGQRIALHTHDLRPLSHSLSLLDSPMRSSMSLADLSRSRSASSPVSPTGDNGFSRSGSILSEGPLGLALSLPTPSPDRRSSISRRADCATSNLARSSFSVDSPADDDAESTAVPGARLLDSSETSGSGLDLDGEDEPATDDADHEYDASSLSGSGQTALRDGASQSIGPLLHDLDALNARFLPSDEPPTLTLCSSDSGDGEVSPRTAFLSDAGSHSADLPSWSAGEADDGANADIGSAASDSDARSSSARPPPPPPLVPPPWSAYWSEEYTRYYYVNANTSESVWNVPGSPGAAKAEAKAKAKAKGKTKAKAKGKTKGRPLSLEAALQASASELRPTRPVDAEVLFNEDPSLALSAPLIGRDVDVGELVVVDSASGGEASSPDSVISSEQISKARAASSPSLASSSAGGWATESSKAIVVVSEKDPESGAMAVVATYLRSESGENALMSATEDFLVRELANERAPNSVYIDAFLLNYRSFMDPLQLMLRLLARFNLSVADGADAEEEAYMAMWRNPVRMRVLNVAFKWVEKFWIIDFAPSPELQAGLNDLIELATEDFPSLAAKLAAKVEDKKAACADDPGFVGKDVSVAGIGEPGSVSLEALQADDGKALAQTSPSVLAHVLTDIEASLFSAVPPAEFVLQLSKRASVPHLDQLVERFNSVSRWVTTQVLVGSSPKRRAKMITFFIHSLLKLVSLNNYNSLMAILSGLSNTSVSRLSATWAKVSSRTKKALRKVEQLMGVDANSARYRAVLRTLKPPAIPFLGLTLQDVLHHADCAPALIDGRINFSKYAELSDIVLALTRFQGSDYSAAFAAKKGSREWDTTHALVSHLYVLDEKAAYKLSKSIEPSR